MARTVINVTPLGLNAGINAAGAGVYQAADATNDMMFEAGDASKLLIHIKNTNASGRTAIVKAGAGGHQSSAWMGPLGDLSVAIPATTGDVLIGPLESARFEQNDGNIYLDLDASTNVTIAVFQLP